MKWDRKIFNSRKRVCEIYRLRKFDCLSKYGTWQDEDSSYGYYIAYVPLGVFCEHNQSIRIGCISDFIVLKVTSFHSRYTIYCRKTKLFLWLRRGGNVNFVILRYVFQRATNCKLFNFYT